MKIRKITTAIVISVAGGLILWDVYAVISDGVQGTISDVIAHAALGYPVIPFAFGFLMGHFFWRE